MRNIGKDVAPMLAGAAIAAASDTNALGNAINMDGFDGCLFIVPITDSAATGVASASVEQCDTSGGTYAPVDDDLATVTCAVNDDLNGKFLMIDINAPAEQFLKLRRVSATANIAYGEAIAIKYGARAKPVALAATDVLARSFPVTPAET